MKDAAEQVLQSFLGKELSQEEAGTLSALMSLRELADGEFLFGEGTADNSLHVRPHHHHDIRLGHRDEGLGTGGFPQGGFQAITCG